MFARPGEVPPPREEELPHYSRGRVTAFCPDCGARTTFVAQTLDGEELEGFDTVSADRQAPNAAIRRYQLLSCASCERGAFSATSTPFRHGQVVPERLVLEEFHPYVRERPRLPRMTPNDLVSEFEEAGRAASGGAWRAGAVMLRSALEKALLRSGYKRGKLADKIRAAAQEAIITKRLAARLDDNVRSLGNDVLHGEWRLLAEEEYLSAESYVVAILEELYEDREMTVRELRAKKRNPDP